MAKEKISQDLIKPHFDAEGKVNIPKGTYLKAVRNVDKDKYMDVFSFFFKSTYGQLQQLHTLTAYRVYFALVLVVTERGGYELQVTQAQLSDLVGCAGSEISKAVVELERVGLVLHHSRGLIVMNPRYVWKGKLADMQDAVIEADKKYRNHLIL